MTARFCGCDEYAYVSAWSIMHFLSGYMWSVVWAFGFGDVLPWLNLLLFALVATAFEVLENRPASGRWMWGWLGYDEKTYAGDSATNTAMDVLISLVGWGVVRIVVEFTLETEALAVLLGVAGALFAVFLFLYRIERRIQLGTPPTPTGVRPALMLQT